MCCEPCCTFKTIFIMYIALCLNVSNKRHIFSATIDNATKIRETSDTFLLSQCRALTGISWGTTGFSSPVSNFFLGFNVRKLVIFYHFLIVLSCCLSSLSVRPQFRWAAGPLSKIDVQFLVIKHLFVFCY